MRSVILYVMLCSSGLLTAASPTLKFGLIQNVVPGAKVESAITAALGKPSEIIDLKSLPRSRESGDLWEYQEQDLNRFSISFEQKSKIVQGWAWTVLEGDEEADLKTTLALFPGASWVAETEKWVNPHQVPMECFFKDYKHGISIAYSRVHKKVTLISRWNPSRKIASEENEKPPRFCISNGCADATLSKEVFKDRPLCELPK